MPARPAKATVNANAQCTRLRKVIAATAPANVTIAKMTKVGGMGELHGYGVTWLQRCIGTALDCYIITSWHRRRNDRFVWRFFLAGATRGTASRRGQPPGSSRQSSG